MEVELGGRRRIMIMMRISLVINMNKKNNANTPVTSRTKKTKHKTSNKQNNKIQE